MNKVMGKKNKKARSITLTVLFVLLVCYFVIYLASMRTTLKKESLYLADTKAKYEAQLYENKELERFITSGDKNEYIDKIAREEGYALPEERVYHDSSIGS